MSIRNRHASGKNNTQATKYEGWLENTFHRRECVKFVPSGGRQGSKHELDETRCGCGRTRAEHRFLRETVMRVAYPDEVWSIESHTQVYPTNAYGTVEFCTGAHPVKLRSVEDKKTQHNFQIFTYVQQFVRLACDANIEKVTELLHSHWKLHLPNLLISIHGGISNFELPPKLQRIFRTGLFKAAKTTGAWIVTASTNTGVMRHVGDALGNSMFQARNHIVTIGIAPWGVIQNNDVLLGEDHICSYNEVAAPKAGSVLLSANHSYFLLADNGTVDRFGAEIILRKRLEKYIFQKRFNQDGGAKDLGTPVVCLILGGGTHTIKTVLEYVSDVPPIPVVVCEGSGRAADLIAFAHNHLDNDGNMLDGLRNQLLMTIQQTFHYNSHQAEQLYDELCTCVQDKSLITVFKMGEESQEIDLAILTTLLKSQNASAPDQLSLVMSWNRADIARSQIFVYGQEWPEGSLDSAMMEALVSDRSDFVKLLLENGINMQAWLTIQRLEDLYNAVLKKSSSPVLELFSMVSNAPKQDRTTILRSILRDVKKKTHPYSYHYSLLDIGLVLETLMGGAYTSLYRSKPFRILYNSSTSRKPETSIPISVAQLAKAGLRLGRPAGAVDRFRYPYSELMCWAVLLCRQDLAKFMWQRGEETLAKALIAYRLYRSMAQEARDDDLEVEVQQQLKDYSKEFAALALNLLEHCYGIDDESTQKLLTYELSNWSNQTCLSLAVSGDLAEFIASTSCQILITELWLGGLIIRKYASFKVILGILFFPSIFLLEFKSKEQLESMPQMEEEYHTMRNSTSRDNLSFSDGAREKKEDVSSLAEKTMEDDEKTEGRDQVGGLASNPLLSFPQGLGSDEDDVFELTKLNAWSKLYEFYTAPITKFWAYSLSFIVFLVMFTYLILAKTPNKPSPLECYVLLYIYGLATEKIREVIMSEPKKLGQKLWLHFKDFWNILDFFGITMAGIGFILRMQEHTLGYGRVFYALSVIFWIIRILDLFSISRHLGPYVNMIGQMLRDLLNFIIILLIFLFAFGLLRQSILYPNEDPHWDLLWNVFHEPYFMLYGEVYAPEINPPCGEGEDIECAPGRWIVPAAQAIYLIIGIVLLTSLLIAVFNNTFMKINRVSNQVWKFQRYFLVIEYESRPNLPPPFIIISHIYLIIKSIVRKCQGKPETFNNSMKLFLDKDDVEILHDFEEECIEDYFREKGQQILNSTEENIRATAERVENISERIDDITQRENRMRTFVQNVDSRLTRLELHSSRATRLAQFLRDVENKKQGFVRPPANSGISRLSKSSLSSVGAGLPDPMDLLLADVYMNPSDLLNVSEPRHRVYSDSAGLRRRTTSAPAADIGADANGSTVSISDTTVADRLTYNSRDSLVRAGPLDSAATSSAASSTEFQSATDFDTLYRFPVYGDTKNSASQSKSSESHRLKPSRGAHSGRVGSGGRSAENLKIESALPEVDETE